MSWSNLASGLLGSLIGAGASIVVASQSNTHNRELEIRNFHKQNIAEAMYEIQGMRDYYKFLPEINIGPGLFRRHESFQIRLDSAEYYYSKIKSRLPLIDKSLRKRWDQLAVLLGEYSVERKWDEVQKNRALADIDGYIRYVKDSLQDYLDGDDIRAHEDRPYLLRHDPEAWIQIREKDLTN